MVVRLMSRKGRVGFDTHYQSVYGSRWAGLRDSLNAPVSKVARANRFVALSHRSGRVEGLERRDFSGIETYVLPSDRRFEAAPAEGLLDFYLMDPASIFAARALETQAGDRVLDLCAAPGGKSLILAEALTEAGELVANELSPQRRARLRAVIEDYLPESVRARVRVSGHDGARWCLHETAAFDRILLDAPCSGERHLLANPEEFELWSPARSKNLAVRQYALLASAIVVVKPGGRVVYSTCSISPSENDDVIARLLKRRAGEAKVVAASGFEIGEATEYGWSIMPDRTGFGPLYFSILERTDVSN